MTVLLEYILMTALLEYLDLFTEIRKVIGWTMGSSPDPLHNILNQELFEKHLCNPRIPIESNRATRPNYQDTRDAPILEYIDIYILQYFLSQYNTILSLLYCNIPQSCSCG